MQEKRFKIPNFVSSLYSPENKDVVEAVYSLEMSDKMSKNFNKFLSYLVSEHVAIAIKSTKMTGDESKWMQGASRVLAEVVEEAMDVIDRRNKPAKSNQIVTSIVA